MRWISLSISTLILGGFAFGCSRDADSQNQPDEGTDKSAVEKTVEDITGVTTIREGKKAEDRVRKIQTEQQRLLQEAVGEDN